MSQEPYPGLPKAALQSTHYFFFYIQVYFLMLWWILLPFSMLTIWKPEEASSNRFLKFILVGTQCNIYEFQVVHVVWSFLLIILCYALICSLQDLIPCLFSGMLYVVRWWWLLYDFFLFLRLLLNIIFVISGSSPCYHSLCCTIPKARVRYTVFGRGILFFSIILQGSACSHCFAFVNSAWAGKKARFMFHSMVKYFSHLNQPADTLPIKHTWSLYTIFFFFLISSASCHLVSDLGIGSTFLALSGKEEFMSWSGFQWWRAFLK